MFIPMFDYQKVKNKMSNAHTSAHPIFEYAEVQ